MKKTSIIVGVIMVLVIGAIFGMLINRQVPNNGIIEFGSVAQSNEYQSTSKVPATTSQLIKATRGTLGSIVVLGAGAEIIIYNASTTNANLRTIAATSSLPILAAMPASAAAGTYTFDIRATEGLLMDIIGTTGTSTITWR